MRLDKLIIGSDKAPTNGADNHRFKNLKNVTIDFDQNHWVTVVIGWNGTGKSNVLEALAIIFRDLIAKERRPAFAFQLSYWMGSGEKLRFIHIVADPDLASEAIQVRVAQAKDINQNNFIHEVLTFDEGADTSPPGKPIKLSAFFKADSEYLPRYIFGYYSGESTRMEGVFRSYTQRYDTKLRNGEDPGLKRLFYAMPVHSNFVLLAFLIQESDVARQFLDKHLSLDPEEGIESVLFVLRQPSWKSKDGDPRFWNARGVVRDFLARLFDIAVAPIEITKRVSTSIWNSETLQFKYLYVKDIASLRRLVGKRSPAEFFRDLESTFVSDLIAEVRIRLRLKNSDGSVTFHELSEGERQLLTVLGLLRFTSGDESLFLLDEPDTHLNPRWCIDYIEYLKTFAGGFQTQAENSHILMTTHNPLAIAELNKEQIQVLSKLGDQKSTEASMPEFDPRGMGFAGILTSDLFKLPSSLDQITFRALETEALLSRKETLTVQEADDLKNAQKELEHAGFKDVFRDPVFEEYARARSELIEGGYHCAENLSEYPRSALRRRVARKLLLKSLGLPLDKTEII